MAYAVALDVKCNEEGCQSRATHEVRSRYNEVMFRCCRAHAEEWVALINEKEQNTSRGKGEQRRLRRL